MYKDLHPTHKETFGYVALGIVAFILIVAGVFFHSRNALARGNAQIRDAAEEFASIAASLGDLPYANLCKGGFINVDGGEKLATISDRIVSSRILRTNPLEYAHTQDEAGITCLSTAKRWVLFTALNSENPEKNPEHFCIDSSGKKGSYGIDRDNTSCKRS